MDHSQKAITAGGVILRKQRRVTSGERRRAGRLFRQAIASVAVASTALRQCDSLPNSTIWEAFRPNCDSTIQTPYPAVVPEASLKHSGRGTQNVFRSTPIGHGRSKESVATN